MKIQLLGTGDAAGWPNAFCSCDSCSVERTAGRFRANTAALVDDILLLDCGPTVPAVAARVGVNLATVEHILITHAHPDHCDPRLLLSRTWSSARHPVHVWGPPRVIDACRPWIGADERCVFHEIEPGVISDHLLATSVGDYRVRAIPSTHQRAGAPIDDLATEALVFAVLGPSAARLLYATDTGPLEDDVITHLEGPYDVVLIEQTFGTFEAHGTGHHDAVSLGAEVRRFRTAGLIDERTRTVAVHLGHHNPPLPELRELMSGIGVEILADGAIVEQEHPARTARVGRSSRALVLGGTRSGKSRWAEMRASRIAASAGEVIVIATGPVPDPESDPEWAERVHAHQARRPASWRTVETADPAAILRGAPAGTCCIVDCLGTWLTGVLDGADAWSTPTPPHVRPAVHDAVTALIEAIEHTAAHVVLVSNEVGMSLVPTTASGRLFTDLLGTVNSRVGAVCDDVVLMVAGRGLAVTSTSP